MMKKLMFAALCATPALAVAAPWPEANPTGYDPYAADAIQRLDYDAAEQRLVRRLDADGSDVSALLNLAAVMGATNRVARASYLYEQVLEADNVLLSLPDGSPVWSHELAQQGLAARAAVANR